MEGISRDEIGGVRRGSPKLQFKYRADIPDDMRAYFEDGLENCVTEETDKAGRKTKYSIGIPTPTSYAAKLGVTRSTLVQWTKEHRGFKLAWDLCCEIGVAAGQKAMVACPGNYKAILILLQVEFGYAVDGGGADELPEIVLCDVDQLPPEVKETYTDDE